METSKVKSGVRNQAEANLNQLKQSESAGTKENQLQALEEEDVPAGTSKENQLGHLSGPSKMMSSMSRGAQEESDVEEEENSSRKLLLTNLLAVAVISTVDESVDSRYSNCGSLLQSGPRPDPRLLRQAALEALTRSARTNTPRKTRPEQFPAKIVGGVS
ncbi:hypothetical protein F511_09018 [Dorcoceras hygrometricum]|uniref:Uncharacterized protein n=1 Tax=Dorcoceras hygrometricum TaxID=472368 RepID=A0A2Z7CE73_9LAMI|nr:hypothetical protein F511_09018 [Dorcoceras hygrometricum]